MPIKQPFGNDLNSGFYGGLDLIGRMTAGQTKAIFTIDQMFSTIRSATAKKGKKVALTIDSSLPAGAILMIYHDASPSGAELTLSTGFNFDAKSGYRRLAMATTAKGTGNYVATFMYNGTSFQAISVLNTTRPLTVNR